MNWIKQIQSYKCYNEQERKDKEIIITSLGLFDDILSRENQIAHITSSAFAVNNERDKVLMVYHKIFQSWSWTGGHADGAEDLLHVASKELREETGISTVKPLSEEIISLDIIPVKGHYKKGRYIAPHLHFSVAFLLEADEDEELVVKPDENCGVQWIKINELATYSNESHMKSIYGKLIFRLENYNK